MLSDPVEGERFVALGDVHVIDLAFVGARVCVFVGHLVAHLLRIIPRVQRWGIITHENGVGREHLMMGRDAGVMRG